MEFTKRVRKSIEVCLRNDNEDISKGCEQKKDLELDVYLNLKIAHKLYEHNLYLLNKYLVSLNK